MSGFIPVKGSSGAGGFIPQPKGGSSHPHGVGGLIDNLAHDVKDAVVGLPLGLEQTFVHPIRAARAFETTTWHTWSPLFHGHVGTFAHGVYDHPLAPLLDVMSVFSLGVGGAAKFGELSTATGRLDEIAAGAKADTFGEKLAALRQPKAIERVDPTDKNRVVPPKQLSTRAGRRVAQEGTHKAFLAAADHLPKWFTQPLKEANFQRAFVSDTAHRHLASMGQYAFAMAAGKQMAEDTPEAIAARANVLAHTHQTLLQKSPHRAKDAASIPDGYVSVLDPQHIDRAARRDLRKAQKQAKYWDNVRQIHAEGAHSVDSLTKQLEAANNQLREMHSKGYLYSVPAKTRLKEPTTKQLITARAVPVKEVEANVERLQKQLDNAHVARGNHNKAVAELDRLGQHIHGYQERAWGQHFTNHASDYQSFTSYLGNFAKMATRGGKSKRALATIDATGARDAAGQLIIVPRHTAEALGQEGAASSAFVRLLWHNPTRVWKMMQVGYSPRTIVNNGVGNWMLFAMRSDPVSGVLGMRDAIRWAKGEHEAADFANASVGVNSHWLSEFKDELGQGGVGGPNVTQTAGGFALREGKTERLKQGFYPQVHKWSDEPVRASALASYMHKDRGVLALAKKNRAKGLTREQAFGRAVRARLVQDAGLHDRAVAFSRSISGDYIALNKLERHVKNIMPFYLWNRHIVHSGINLTLDTPGRVAMLQSISNQGTDLAEKVLGPLPDFLKGAVPLSILGILGKSGGRVNAISTQGLNPFATIGDLAEGAQAVATGGGLHPGETTVGQLFPAIPAAVEWATKKSLLTGNDLKTTGPPLAFIAKQIAAQIPEIRVGESLVNPQSSTTPKGNPTLYGKTSTESLSSLLGIPIKQIDLSAANAVAAKQDPTKKKRHGFVTG